MAAPLQIEVKIKSETFLMILVQAIIKILNMPSRFFRQEKLTKAMLEQIIRKS